MNEERCDQKIFDEGTHVGSYTLSKDIMNSVTKMLQKQGHIVDWHYIGGGVNVLALTDIEPIKEQLDLYQQAYNEGLNDYIKYIS